MTTKSLKQRGGSMQTKQNSVGERRRPIRNTRTKQPRIQTPHGTISAATRTGCCGNSDKTEPCRPTALLHTLLSGSGSAILQSIFMNVLMKFSCALPKCIRRTSVFAKTSTVMAAEPPHLWPAPFYPAVPPDIDGHSCTTRLAGGFVFRILLVLNRLKPLDRERTVCHLQTVLSIVSALLYQPPLRCPAERRLHPDRNSDSLFLIAVSQHIVQISPKNSFDLFFCHC